MINAESRGFPFYLPHIKNYHPLDKRSNISPKSLIRVFPERCKFIFIYPILANTESSPDVYKTYIPETETRKENKLLNNSYSDRITKDSINKHAFFSENYFSNSHSKSINSINSLYPINPTNSANSLKLLNKVNIKRVAKFDNLYTNTAMIDNIDKNMQYYIPKTNIHEISHLKKSVLVKTTDRGVEEINNHKVESIPDPTYLINCNDYNISESYGINEDRLMTYETKPVTDFNNILGYGKSYNDLPGVKVSKCPKFYEK